MSIQKYDIQMFVILQFRGTFVLGLSLQIVTIIDGLKLKIVIAVNLIMVY